MTISSQTEGAMRSRAKYWVGPAIAGWAPRRQYVVTLSGRGEVELADGKKIPLEPGHILLAEDLTGKGHISRGLGTEDRISLFIHLAEP